MFPSWATRGLPRHRRNAPTDVVHEPSGHTYTSSTRYRGIAKLFRFHPIVRKVPLGGTDFLKQRGMVLPFVWVGVFVSAASDKIFVEQLVRNVQAVGGGQVQSQTQSQTRRVYRKLSKHMTKVADVARFSYDASEVLLLVIELY